MAFDDMKVNVLKCNKCFSVLFKTEYEYVFTRDEREKKISQEHKHKYVICANCGNRISADDDPFFKF